MMFGFQVASSTPDDKFKKLLATCERYLNSRPQEFVKNSLYVMLLDVQPKAMKTVEFWLTHVSSWNDWKTVYASRTQFMEFIVEICDALDIDYRLPVQPLSVSSMPQVGFIQQENQQGDGGDDAGGGGGGGEARGWPAMAQLGTNVRQRTVRSGEVSARRVY
eukprot:GHVN01050814.1.p1 GENE.GHVN01050814.1~~GHVN01050814.1.p1  ORF type:complete len:162 (-),score=25.56 GHVN01050814.1:237-722(-)